MYKIKTLAVFGLLVLLLSLPVMALSNATASVNAQDGNTHEIVFTIPVGPEGVQYQGEGIPEMLVGGPMAFAAAPDGSFWVADTVGNRLLHHSPKGNALGMVDLAGQAVGIGDLEVTGSDVLVLDIAAVIPRVLRLSPAGKLLARYELPEGLRLENGLSGIALGDQGEILVEREGGAWVTRLVDAAGRVAPVPLAGYIYRGRLYSTQPADMRAEDTRRGYITAGDKRIEVAVPHDLGGLRILGFGRDDSFT